MFNGPVLHPSHQLIYRSKKINGFFHHTKQKCVVLLRTTLLKEISIVSLPILQAIIVILFNIRYYSLAQSSEESILPLLNHIK